MASDPLFEFYGDAPERAKDPAPATEGVRPLLVASIAEIFLLNTIARFIFDYSSGGFALSPQEAVWFSWAPESARRWLFCLSVAGVDGTLKTGLALVCYFSMPADWRKRFTMRFLPFGSPPLLGAAVLVALGFLPVVLVDFGMKYGD